MEPFQSNAVHIVTRAVLILVGALLLWAAPTSVTGLVVMLVGLVCAVSGVALEKTRQF
jgi:1,4-dihydroxy-2-naphthoate octaprenyltransferase